jgi:hypothetical protein
MSAGELDLKLQKSLLQSLLLPMFNFKIKVDKPEGVDRAQVRWTRHASHLRWSYFKMQSEVKFTL